MNVTKSFWQKERINMKSTGVVRRVDELGRIVLPIEIRKNLDIENRDAVEIFIENDKIILKKYNKKPQKWIIRG